MATTPKLNLKDPNSIAAHLQAQMDAANAANQARYQQGLGALKTGNQSAAGFLQMALADSANIGQSAVRRVQQQLQHDIGSTEQEAISRGLGNTTIRNALLDMDRRRANDALADINEQIANRRANLRLAQSQLAMGGSGRVADFIAARNDLGPDLGFYSNLIQNALAAPDPNAQKATATVLGSSFSGSQSLSDALKSTSGGSYAPSIANQGGEYLAGSSLKQSGENYFIKGSPDSSISSAVSGGSVPSEGGFAFLGSKGSVVPGGYDPGSGTIQIIGDTTGKGIGSVRVHNNQQSDLDARMKAYREEIRELQRSRDIVFDRDYRRVAEKYGLKWSPTRGVYAEGS